MKDIFIDNDAATNFLNPQQEQYKALFKWLMSEGYLVVSQKLLAEYHRTSGACCLAVNICTVVAELTKRGRLVRFGKDNLGQFPIPKRVERKLKSNQKDRVHLKTVLLSVRKYALSMDQNLCDDINNFPGYVALARSDPQAIPYDS